MYMREPSIALWGLDVSIYGIVCVFRNCVLLVRQTTLVKIGAIYLNQLLIRRGQTESTFMGQGLVVSQDRS